MSHLTYQNFLISNTLPTPSTYHSSNHIFLIIMRSFQPDNWTNLTQLKVTDGKLSKSYSSDLNLELHNLNMQRNGKAMNIKTIAVSMQKILMSN